jgi:membrane protein
MAKKASRFQRIREAAQALLNVRGPGALADFSNWQKFARFWVLVWTSFSRNRCPVRASALAYVTVLAIIPMLAVAMSIASGLLKKEGEDQIDQFIVKVIASVIPPATINTNLASMDTSLTGTPTNRPAAPEAPTETTNVLAASESVGEADTNLAPSSTEADQAARVRWAIARSIHKFIQNTRSGALGVTGSILLIFAAISMLSRIEETFNDIWGVARGRGWFMRIVL